MKFGELHSVLRPLTFDTERDPEITDPELREYLKHYAIDFSRQYDVPHRMGNFSAAGFEIATHYWNFEFARGTVFVFHDHFDHVGLLSHLIRWCLSEHYSVVAIDFPGHGLSTGEKASIDSFDEYGEVLATLISLCNKKFANPFFCIAHGAGAAAVMNLMWMQAKRPFAKMVFLAPLVRPRDWSNAKYYLAKTFLKTAKRRFVENSGNKKFVEFVRKDDPLQSKRAPIKWTSAMREWMVAFPSMPKEIMRPLIIQGNQDITMDWKYNVKQLKARFPNGTMMVLKGVNHHLANEKEGIRKAIFARIKNYLDQGYGAS